MSSSIYIYNPLFLSNCCFMPFSWSSNSQRASGSLFTEFERKWCSCQSTICSFQRVNQNKWFISLSNSLNSGKIRFHFYLDQIYIAISNSNCNISFWVTLMLWNVTAFSGLDRMFRGATMRYWCVVAMNSFLKAWGKAFLNPLKISYKYTFIRGILNIDCWKN